MRKINSVIAASLIVLFIVHLVWGAFIMTGLIDGGSMVFRYIAVIFLILLFAHMVIGFKLSLDTNKAQKKSKVQYKKANRLFWLRRDSGYAVLLFVLVHIYIFTTVDFKGVSRLKEFNPVYLVCMLLMVLSLVIHLLTNIKPLRIALGLKDTGNKRTDLLVVLSVLLIFAAVAFIIYFIRWHII